jgi:hypothetical protein
MADPGPQLARLAPGMREAGAARRTQFAVGGFSLHLDLENPNPHLSVAVPDDDPPAAWGAALVDLQRLCAGAIRSRCPRSRARGASSGTVARTSWPGDRGRRPTAPSVSRTT